MRRWLYAAWLVSATACGSSGDDLILIATPSEVEANGLTVVELFAEVEFRGEALPDGQRVTFTATQPLLFATREATMPTVTGGRAEGSGSLEIQTRGGRATAFLLAPTSASQPLTVSATYTTVNQDALEDRFELPLRTPQLVASGRPGPNGCSDSSVPFASNQLGFAFTCDRKNVGAFVTGRPAIEVDCRIEAFGADGTELPFVPVQLFAEAGELMDRPATSDAPRRVTHRIPVTLSGFPRDTRPTIEEETLSLVEIGGSPIPGAQESNPRDGLVTLLAVVRGEEAYFDANGNGGYDPGEPFCDEGEPFLDVDDDGVFSEAVDTACCDSNNNGFVDGRNGRWDSNILIGRMAHVVWSGRPNRARISPNPATVMAQGAANLQLEVLDGSFNPVAAGDSRDAVEIGVSPRGSVGLSTGTLDEFPLRDTLGMNLREGFPRFVFGATGVSVFDGFSTEDTERFGRRFPFTLVDERSGNALCSSTDFEVQVDVTSTPGVEYGSTDFAANISRVLSGGTVGALSGTCPP
ncbi:MAG: hypothetical protein AAF654_11825 [Myxococcota bacterium]